VRTEGQANVVEVMVIEALFRNQLMNSVTSAFSPTDLVVGGKVKLPLSLPNKAVRH
jgi:hypothetical protein